MFSLIKMYCMAIVTKSRYKISLSFSAWLSKQQKQCISLSHSSKKNFVLTHGHTHKMWRDIAEEGKSARYRGWFSFAIQNDFTHKQPAAKYRTIAVIACQIFPLLPLNWGVLEGHYK